MLRRLALLAAMMPLAACSDLAAPTAAPIAAPSPARPVCTDMTTARVAFGVAKRETHIVDVTIADQTQGGTEHFDIQGDVSGGASGDLPGPAWALWLQTEAAKAGLGELMIDDLPREQVTLSVTGKGPDIKIKSFGVEKVAATYEIDCGASRHSGTLRGWAHYTRVDFTCGDPGLAASTSNRATAAAMETELRNRFCD